ncbi:hypothetical protein D9M68_919280 [compost metagenome]
MRVVPEHLRRLVMSGSLDDDIGRDGIAGGRDALGGRQQRLAQRRPHVHDHMAVALDPITPFLHGALGTLGFFHVGKTLPGLLDLGIA